MPSRAIFNILGLFGIIFLVITTNSYAGSPDMKIKLTPDRLEGKSLSLLLKERYSCRNFQDKVLKLENISALLWAACGKKHDSLTGASRTIPSAGATYPLELYLVTGENSVKGLHAGVYHYLIDEHALEVIIKGDERERLMRACLGQDSIYAAPASLVIAARFVNTTGRYGARGERYVHMEAGHAGQNIYLACVNMGLATCEVGAFDDEAVRSVINSNKDLVPLLIMPVGSPE
ncbi:MAG: SagB/ThcOx family dehydrogenase [Candidatus Omnitrophota bacterium]